MMKICIYSVGMCRDSHMEKKKHVIRVGFSYPELIINQKGV